MKKNTTTKHGFFTHVFDVNRGPAEHKSKRGSSGSDKDKNTCKVFWADARGAYTHAGEYTVLIGVADEFPTKLFNDHRHLHVFVVPVHEAASPQQERKLLLSQRDDPMRRSLNIVTTYRDLQPMRTEELVDWAASKGANICIACMAGRNRSAASILRYLLLKRQIPDISSGVRMLKSMATKVTGIDVVRERPYLHYEVRIQLETLASHLAGV